MKDKIILVNTFIAKMVPVVVFSLMMLSCNLLDTKEDLFLTDEMLETSYYQMMDFGYKAYSHLPYGFSAIDNNLFAGVSDEAQYVSSVSETQRFNEGTWNQYYNPNDVFSWMYSAIYDVNYYLENSDNYTEVLGRNRDTMNTSGMDSYIQDIQDVKRLRAEANVLKAFYYLELAKRYGGIPIVNQTFEDPNDANLPRASFNEVVTEIVSLVDHSKNELVLDWASVGMSELDGRLTQGAALAIKSKALLYAASPQFNTNNSIEKWIAAAEAANEIIKMDKYVLHPSYRELFIKDNSASSDETIWAVRYGQNNDLEHANYPIGTPGGNTGLTPTQNLVNAYELKGEKTSNPYANLDPRFYASVLKNGDSWNGRILEIYEGGTDDPNNENASCTGYYLKKFLNEDLNLTNEASELRSWIIFRYAEILLNYAEAMNEAFGPDNNNGFSMTAREAIDAVRARADVDMPVVNVSSDNKNAMREAIKNERRIELAFEDHRYWDLRRWLDAEQALNTDIKGVKVEINENVVSSNEFVVSKRVFDSKMYLYPIPEYVIVNSNGVLDQNLGW